jgi:SAM-dependent methyltransferase
MTITRTDDPTLAYYEDQAETFFAETVDVDMAPLYARFLARVPPGGHILDAGCGSGRDALAFRRLGYAVTAFEASPTLARLATAHCGLPVEVRRFQEIDWEDRFDGIWACASLLHVPMAELPEVLGRLGRALKSDGVLYASFKYGVGEREHEGGGSRIWTRRGSRGWSRRCRRAWYSRPGSPGIGGREGKGSGG